MGTPCWAASMTARPQPSFARRHQVHVGRREEFVFAAFVDVAVERDVVVDTELSGIRLEPVVPPTAADHVQARRRGVCRRSSTTSRACSTCLCGTNRDSTHSRAVDGESVDGVGARAGRQAPGRCRCGSR